MTNFSFPKSERLTNKKKFSKLFESGSSLTSYPLKLVYILEKDLSDIFPFQIAFTVPKRKFKRAVDRNYIKRRMREAYRLHKPQLIIDDKNSMLKGYGILIFIGKEKLEFEIIAKAWHKLNDKFKSHQGHSN